MRKASLKYSGQQEGEKVMKVARLTWISYVLAAFMLISIGSVCALAKEAVRSPLLDGKWWNQMSQDEKAAYIWGAGDVVDLEQEFMSIYPELKSENFSAKTVEGIGDVGFEKIIATVDQFYSSNPDKLDYTVLRVIWDAMIKPNLKTGIAGRPLK
jgi:hypothetical protein